jgi:hypothetical protein
MRLSLGGHHAWGRVLAGVAVLVAVSALFATGAGAATVPPPSQDSFYAVPSGIATLSNGDVVASRAVSANFYGLPTLAHAWQVKYKSTDNQDAATADVETILIPRTRWLGKGPRPLVSYQTARTGASTLCAPSYALETGPATTTDNSELETGIIELALLRGWAVDVPDYEGPSGDFLGAAGEAHGVLDGIRAALAFTPAALPADTPVAMWVTRMARLRPAARRSFSPPTHPS